MPGGMIGSIGVIENVHCGVEVGILEGERARSFEHLFERGLLFGKNGLIPMVEPLGAVVANQIFADFFEARGGLGVSGGNAMRQNDGIDRHGRCGCDGKLTRRNLEREFAVAADGRLEGGEFRKKRRSVGAKTNVMRRADDQTFARTAAEEVAGVVTDEGPVAAGAGVAERAFALAGIAGDEEAAAVAGDGRPMHGREIQGSDQLKGHRVQEMIDEIGAIVDDAFMERSLGFSSAGIAHGDVIRIGHDREQMPVAMKTRRGRPVGTTRAGAGGDLESQFNGGIVKGLQPGIPFSVGGRDDGFGVRPHADREAERIESRLEWGG
jgi:hypothetical protein